MRGCAKAWASTCLTGVGASASARNAPSRSSASPPSARSDVAAWTACRRSIGSGSSHGSSKNTNEMRLPSSASPAPRTSAGTMTLSRCGPAKRRSAPAQAASTTSLGVTPKRRRSVAQLVERARRAHVVAAGRAGAVERRAAGAGGSRVCASGAGEAGARRAAAPASSRASPARARARRRRPRGRRPRGRSAAATTASAPAPTPRARRGPRSGSASSISLPSSTIAMPSTMQWWALPIMAIRPSASSSAIQNCHSGRSRGSGSRRSRRRSRRGRRRARAGRAAAGSKSGSSTHAGSVIAERHRRRACAASAARARSGRRGVEQLGEARGASRPRAGRRSTPSRRASARPGSRPRGRRRPAPTAARWSRLALQQRPPVVVRQPRGLGGRRRSPPSTRGEAVRVVLLGHVPGALEDSRSGCRASPRARRAPCATGMIESFSPHTISDGSDGGEREPVVRADALAAGLDDRAQRCARKAWREPALSSSAKPRASTAMSPAGRRPTRPSRPPTPRPRSDQPLRGQRRQHVVGARQRGGAQQQVDVAAEAAAGDQHEPLGALGELVGELHRDAAAERVADHGDAVVAERGQRRRARRWRARRASSRRAGVADSPWPEQVGRDHREVLAQQRGDRAPTCRDELAIPCRSSSAGPLPAIR